MQPVPADRSALAAAATSLLARDGREFVLRPWQAAYLIALAGGRDGEIPIACGLGRGWLDARLAEALAEVDPDRGQGPR